MLHTAHLHVSYWEFAVLTASFVHNRTYHRGVDGVPITLVSGIVPDLSSLRTFGCPAYVHVPAGQRRKLADTAFKGIFVGYSTDNYGYLVYNPQTHRVVVTRHVKFDETFGGRLIEEGQSPVVNDMAADTTTAETEEEVHSSSDDDDILDPIHYLPTPASSNGTSLKNDHPKTTGQDSPPTTGSFPNMSSDNSSFSPTATPPPRGVTTISMAQRNLPIAKRTRTGAANQGFLLATDDDDHPYLSNLSAFVNVMNSTPVDPPTRRAAMKSENAEKWKGAAKEELTSMNEMKTWTLVPPPAGANIVSSKWVYKIKTNSDGSIARFKARLVARGFTQIAGVDYEETFAPTAKFATIRLMLSLACSLQWPVEQANIDTAFLWAELEDDIYMQHPPGHEDPDHPHYACKLLRFLYGLKQSAHLWNQLLSKTLVDLGYRQLVTDPTCFVKIDEQGTCIILAAYVDDLVIMGRTLEHIKTAKNELKEKFKVKDLGEINWLLGVSIERDITSGTLTMHQHKYIMDMVHKFGQEDSAPVTLPHAGGDDKQPTEVT